MIRTSILYSIRRASLTVSSRSLVASNRPAAANSTYEQVPDRWEWVERILPQAVVPNPPTHASYPTPSGWVPPTATEIDAYAVRRTRNHMFPVYVEVPTKEKGLKQYTKIKHIEGDIWAFETDLRKYLEDKTGKRIHIQVLEYSMTVAVDGIYHGEVSDFLLAKGF